MGAFEGTTAPVVSWSQSDLNLNATDSPVSLTAASSTFTPSSTPAAAAITYTSDNGCVTISGSTMTIVSSGTAHITASQASNSFYAASNSVSKNVTVNKVDQTITLAATGSKTYGDADYSPATASSGLTVTYGNISNSSVATIVSGKIHIVGAGTTTFTASQAGSGKYNAATDANQTLTVNPATITITAGNQSIAYGTAASVVTTAGSSTPTGFVNGEGAGVIGGSATYSTTYTNTTAAGTASVTITPIVTSLTATNYSFSPIAGTVTITQATPTLSLASSSVNYNGSAQAATVNGSVSGSASNVKYDGSSTAPTAVGTYAVTADFAPTDGTNYASLTAASAGTFSINATVPDAPTIGTATAGNTQVSVAFTAPSNDGGSTIIDYAVTPYIGASAGTPVTGSASPIVVTGLTNGTAYTFTVTARNSVGGSSASSASNSATPVSASITVSADANLSSYSPTSATDVTVSAGELTVDADASVKTMTVAPGAKLTLSTGKTLTVTGALTLQSDATGTATFVDNGGTISAASTNVEQYLTSGRNWYISSPISNGTTAIFNPEGGSNHLFWYDESKGSTNPWAYSTRNDSTLQVMRGYVANMASTGVVTFTGLLNTGDKSIDVTRTAGQTKEGFNLVGNPYPSYLDWDNVTKTNLSTTLWYRTKTAPVLGATTWVFDTYNATGKLGTSLGAKAVTNLIPPMQAFWVRVDKNQTSGTLAVANSQRSHADNGSNGFKSKLSTESTQSVLRLEVSNGLNSDQALVYFNTDASNSFDNYDSPKMPNYIASIPEIYTLAGNEQVVINGVNNVSQLALGFTTGQAGNFTIKASQFTNFVSGSQIVLRDNVLNVEQDLTFADYNFNSEITNNNESRFTLLFKAPSVATGFNQNSSANVWISIRNGQLVVNGNSSNETIVSVYNAVGQKIASQRLTESTKALNTQLATGVYMVSVSNAGKSVTKKVIID
ncbi:MAG: T9SS type A sorting domain-containing protein [Paludibacter sp.]